jgi:hypothetical protein
MTYERQQLVAYLQAHDGNISKTARVLEVKRTTLIYHLEQQNLLAYARALRPRPDGRPKLPREGLLDPQHVASVYAGSGSFKAAAEKLDCSASLVRTIVRQEVEECEEDG